jgi:hypothetical protein
VEWREWARQKRELMQRFNSEKEALIADNKRLRSSMDPSVPRVSFLRSWRHVIPPWPIARCLALLLRRGLW